MSENEATGVWGKPGLRETGSGVLLGLVRVRQTLIGTLFCVVPTGSLSAYRSRFSFSFATKQQTYDTKLIWTNGRQEVALKTISTNCTSSGERSQINTDTEQTSSSHPSVEDVKTTIINNATWVPGEDQMPLWRWREEGSHGGREKRGCPDLWIKPCLSLVWDNPSVFSLECRQWEIWT